MPLLVTGVMGAEEEAKSVLASAISQILTLLRAIVTYALEISRKIFSYFGEHPLASLLIITNLAIMIT